MYRIDEILEKINTSGPRSMPVTLPDLFFRSFPEVRKMTGDSLSWGETRYLYQQAQKELKENKMAESRILTRANPQLANAVRLGIRQAAGSRSYDEWFGSRADRFARPGSVASMFSPAAYLTELYREAKDLHPATSQFRLETRRPDLATLALSQDNMDDELSTLSLSSELLYRGIGAAEGLDDDGVREMLAGYRLTGQTPWHRAYEAARQAILQQDPALTAFSRNPDVAQLMDQASLLAIESDISPELYRILTEEITAENSAELWVKTFGDVSVSIFTSPDYLARYYDIDHDTLASLLGMVSFSGSLADALLTEVNLPTNLACQVTTLGEQRYQVRFTILKQGITDLGYGLYIQGWQMPVTRKYWQDSSFKYARDIEYTVDITIPDDDFINNTLTLYIWQSTSTTSALGISQVTVTLVKAPNNETLYLKLNKVLRLYKATGLTPAELFQITSTFNDSLTINHEVLSKIFQVRYLMNRYRLDIARALVLCNGLISDQSFSGGSGLFTTLFNTPLLNEQLFSADDAPLDFRSEAPEDVFRLNVLGRAFGVSVSALAVLWQMAGGDTGFTCSASNIAALYRTWLLADIHDLSVSELSMLLSVSPYSGVVTGELSDDALTTLTRYMYQTTAWFTEQGWTVSDVFLMLTTQYSTLLTPDIENLLVSLRNGLSGRELSTETLSGEAAPFIAAAMRLDVMDTAEAMLTWANQLQPGGLKLSDFILLVMNDAPDEHQSGQMAEFCQVLGQLALIIRSTGLSSRELTLLVSQPGRFRAGWTSLPHDLLALRDMTRFHAIVNRSGSHAGEVLTALETGELSSALLARALSQNEQDVTGALAQVRRGGDQDGSVFATWEEVDQTEQWLDMSGTLSITPSGLAGLIALKYINVSDESAPSYSQWQAVSGLLQAGLNGSQSSVLHDYLEEGASSALCAYYLRNLAPVMVFSRDDLFGYLLLDNQVSAQVKTTRIAEAIASVQLYVNRALNGQEEGVDYAIKSKKFFSTDWDTYNKRYSTWAGVSQLVYYPENYVDPTLRIGQTGMMDEMLQTLSQSQLTNDTVEDAFKTYMTRFEEIANLNIISGYHDSASDQNGTTWLVGKSAVGDYYWRSVDIGKMSDGKLPANAWSEWKKVTAALDPVNNLVRPVIFQSRLYLVWSESRETATTSGSATTKGTEYLLKYAHILHDGTWSAPVSVALNSEIPSLSFQDADVTGMYCAKDVEQEKLYIYFYKKESSYLMLPSSLAGLSLSSSGQTEFISADAAARMTGYIYLQLDTTSAVRLNTPYTGGETKINISGNNTDGGSWGELNYTFVNGGQLSVSSVSLSGDNIDINFDATTRIIYNGSSVTRFRTQLEMMKSIGSMGKTFYLPQLVNKSPSAITYGRNFECIFMDYLYVYRAAVLVNDSIPAVSGDGIYGFNDLSKERLNMLVQTNSVYSFSKDASNSKLWVRTQTEFQPTNYVFTFMSPYSTSDAEFILSPVELMFGDFKKINTSLPTENVKLSVGSKSFTADTRSKYTFEESLFKFNKKSVSVPLSTFRGNTAQIAFSMSVDAPSDDSRSSLGREICTLTLTRIDESSMPVISLNKTTDGAQYLQYGFYRVRVNTLFAKQLVARANKGLNAILSMETQLLGEPKPGEGNYVNVTFSEYDETLHGDGWFKLYLLGTEATPDNSRSKYLYTSGNISTEHETTLSLFLPWDPAKSGSERYSVYIGVQYSDADFTSTYLDMQCYKYDPAAGTYESFSKKTRGMTSSEVNSPSEPMDFNGANALYFWEMFYYVPMMVFRRLLSESKFTEASQWLKYVWSPDGYLMNGQPAPWIWNVRPLEEETNWHSDPLDSVDPDAIAQNDPMHYKVATFMSYLDLLIARGDAAYRLLERDTLNEARMWYVQALNLLGDEPYISFDADWSALTLGDAASEVTRRDYQEALLAVRRQEPSPDNRTANSLTALFLPQQNGVLKGYWQTLAQRLYNLRHNLSIDGQPLSLSVYATPYEPSALLSAAVNSAQGAAALPGAVMPLYRFPVMLENARGMVSQLIGFGHTLLGITERQDAEALAELLQTQGSELILQGLRQQDNVLAEIDADIAALEESRRGAQMRFERYSALYEADVNTGEKQAMNLYLSSSVLAASSDALFMAGAAADMLPNIYGLAIGGSRYGALFNAAAIGIQVSSDATRISADKISQSEVYRRRREEWEIQSDSAQSDVKQIDAQLTAMTVRRTGAELQKTYLETQQTQTQAQLAFLQGKFSNTALYNWLRGRLSAIYYQFYDLAVSRCLMAQQAWQWDKLETRSFIQPGAWMGANAGLLAGETLMLNLAQMEQEWLKEDERAKEVTRTVCLSEVYAGLAGDAAFSLAGRVADLVSVGSGTAGTESNGLQMENQQLLTTLKLSDLGIGSDYPAFLGPVRRIKQISITLPALVGPYQDVRAVLSYGGSVVMPRGCSALAVSHGMNDSGQFQLDFNDPRYLPFEGLPVDDSGILTLSFPDADGRQKDLLLSLTDIILHIRYTITA